MSLIEPDFVQVVAEGLGIKPTLDASTTLAPDVEYRLREIVQVNIET
jgi:TATA box binding protein associated factor (TAF)